MAKIKQKKRRDLKIIWSSNAPHTNSGYAVATRDILYRLLQDGWNIACIGFFGAEGYHMYLHGEDLIDDRFKGTKLKIYPKMNEPYGGDALVHHSKDFGAHVAFAMQDLQTLDTQALNTLASNGTKFIPYLPIDQDPPLPLIFNNLNIAHKIVTFSQFGKKVLQDKGYTSNLIVEGVDIELHKPLNRAKCREEFGLPQDAFIFGMISANKENPPRKGFQEALEAFKLFADKHPEARLFFHTQQTSGSSFPILEYGRHLGIADKLLFYNQYMATFKANVVEVNKQINAFDCVLHPSQTEGFGMLVVEAQAAGVPVIVNRCHSQPELVIEGVTGEVCETGKAWWRNLNAYVYPADVNSLYEKMEIVYARSKDPKAAKKSSDAAREHVLKNYNIDTIVKEKWIPYLEDLQDEILPNS